MTEDDRIAAMMREIENMRQAREKLDDLHDFFMGEPVGKPSRAKQVDDLLAVVRAGRMGARVILWTAGFFAALGAITAQVKGWWPK